MLRQTFLAAPRLEGIQEEDDNSEELILENSEQDDSENGVQTPPIIRLADKLFMHGRKALTIDDTSESTSVLTLNPENQENQQSIHYARGCHRMLGNYLSDNETTLEYNTNDHLSNIDNPLLLNIQSIIDVGIRRKNLREELYCQAILGLHNARSSRETRLAWIFFSLIVGCFLPPSRVRPFVDEILRDASNENNQDAIYCSKKLLRSTETMQNSPQGENGLDQLHEIRHQRRGPPCSLEFWAAVRKTSAAVSVMCPDEARRTVVADSASTAQEIVEAVCTRLEIKDSFGFALFIRAGSRLAPVGEGGVYLMDVYWQTERYTSENNLDPPKLHFRRDVFPLRWHPEKDRPAARLVFAQVCSSIKNGENATKNSQDLALLVAYQYLLEFKGMDPTDKRLSLHCTQVMPTQIFKSNKKEWIRMVSKTLTALKIENPNGIPQDDLIEQVVRFSLGTWPASFSRKYDLRGFTILGSPDDFLNTAVTLEINHKWVKVKSLQGEEHLAICTKDIKKCFLKPAREDGCGRIQIATEQHIYTLVTPFSTELHKIMNRLIAA